MACTRQAVPFQVSARLTPRRVALPMAAPTAMQEVADAQDTPVKVLLAAPMGRMVCWIPPARAVPPLRQGEPRTGQAGRVGADRGATGGGATRDRRELIDLSAGQIRRRLDLPHVARGRAWLARLRRARGHNRGEAEQRNCRAKQPDRTHPAHPRPRPAAAPSDLTCSVRLSHASALHSARADPAAALTGECRANSPSGRRILRWKLSAPDRLRTSPSVPSAAHLAVDRLDAVWLAGARGVCQRPLCAARYCSATLAGMRPRSLTTMPRSFRYRCPRLYC